MSNLFNLSFSFSTNPQIFNNLLQHRLNIKLNSNEDKWSEKAIKGLIKRLTKTSMIDDLQTALNTKNSQTRCVTIPRYKLILKNFILLFVLIQKCTK